MPGGMAQYPSVPSSCASQCLGEALPAITATTPDPTPTPPCLRPCLPGAASPPWPSRARTHTVVAHHPRPTPQRARPRPSAPDRHSRERVVEERNGVEAKGNGEAGAGEERRRHEHGADPVPPVVAGVQPARHVAAWKQATWRGGGQAGLQQIMCASACVRACAYARAQGGGQTDGDELH